MYYMGCVKITSLTIAFNVVMPLSRASTRGRYSRIVGVTRGDQGEASHPSRLGMDIEEDRSDEGADSDGDGFRWGLATGLRGTPSRGK